MYVVRYSEIGLKGRNRRYFEDTLVSNLERRLAGPGVLKVSRIRGRILVNFEPGARGGPIEIADRIADTPGVRSFSLAHQVAPDLAAIEAKAIELSRVRLADAPGTRTYGVKTVRIDKAFPMNSGEVSARIGHAIGSALPALRVNLGEPDLSVGIELYTDRAYLMTDWRDGPGGLPVGTAGRVVLLLSGGIDSPVAGWYLQRRGCDLAPVFCHAFPFTGDAAKEKVIDLARSLAARQARLELRIVPIGEAQVALRDACRADLLVVLYRRLMVRIGCRVAELLRAPALATGENIGQVASQTLPNMRAIDAVATHPILRPLCGFDKEDTIRVAQRIGTFETSIRPADDTCQLFLPKHPATSCSLETVEREESRLDVDALVDACMVKIEVVKFFRGEIDARKDQPAAVVAGSPPEPEPA